MVILLKPVYWAQTKTRYRITKENIMRNKNDALNTFSHAASPRYLYNKDIYTTRIKIMIIFTYVLCNLVMIYLSTATCILSISSGGLFWNRGWDWRSSDIVYWKMNRIQLNNYKNGYLSLTEFEGRTVSYRARFFHLNLWPQRKHERRELRGKRQVP